jgi:hypothetical protein
VVPVDTVTESDGIRVYATRADDVPMVDVAGRGRLLDEGEKHSSKAGVAPS